MKKLLVLVFVLALVFALTACEEEPHEECITEYTFKLEERSKFFISYTAYVFETEYGDTDVTKNIYEAGQAGEYAEICVLVLPDGQVNFLSGTLIDGTPIDQDLIDEIADQVIPEGLDEKEPIE